MINADITVHLHVFNPNLNLEEIRMTIDEAFAKVEAAISAERTEVIAKIEELKSQIDTGISEAKIVARLETLASEVKGIYTTPIAEDQPQPDPNPTEVGPVPES